ncbi:MAG: ubiquitin-like small modifier protein 1 [Methanotrichaceae archaeon]
MRVKVRPFAGFRNILGKEVNVDLNKGSSVEDLLRMLCSEHEGLKARLFDDEGLKEDVNILVNGKNIASLNGIKIELKDGDEVVLLSAAIGG